MTNELPEHSPVELQADDCGALITISRQWYEEAIDALRAQEKEPCEICSGNGLPCDNGCDGFCDICDIPEVWKTIHKTGQYNYCPMCGRPLK